VLTFKLFASCADSSGGKYQNFLTTEAVVHGTKGAGAIWGEPDYADYSESKTSGKAGGLRL
jgi:hypothetical protein